MPPSVPDSKPVFATLYIKKVVLVPTTFEFRPPDKSYVYLPLHNNIIEK